LQQVGDGTQIRRERDDRADIQIARCMFIDLLLLAEPGG
jgi:hypothetical protein